jgi:RNA polymerase-associated protein
MALLANRRSVMSLYSDAADPCSHAVRFVLSEKAINVEIRYVSDDDKPEDLNDLNPYNTILTLVDRELVLYEPQIIMEYLDERFPHPPLMPVDPVARANNRLYRYRIQRDIYGLVDELESGETARVNAARKSLRDHLTAIAPVFGQKPFFMSDDYSLVDCYLVPILWRLTRYDIKLPAQAKALRQYADRMFEREAFEASLTEAEREMGEL